MAQLSLYGMFKAAKWHLLIARLSQTLPIDLVVQEIKVYLRMSQGI